MLRRCARACAAVYTWVQLGALYSTQHEMLSGHVDSTMQMHCLDMLATPQADTEQTQHSVLVQWKPTRLLTHSTTCCLQVALEDGRCVFDTQEEWVYLYGNNFLVLWPKQRTQGTGFSTQALSNRESVSADPFDGQRSSGITQQLQLEGQVQEQEQLQQQQQDGQEQERQEAQQQQEQGQEKRDQQQPLQHSPNVVAEPTAAEPVAADERMQPRRVGLKNQGATCYQNVVLQYLYHLPLFRKVSICIYLRLPLRRMLS